MKRLIRDEQGQAMVLVLILLLISGLIIAPLLAYMGTGLIAGEVYERRTAELYAADAGVEDAVWKIQHQVDEVEGLDKCYPDWSYNMTDVNDKSVEVTITYVDGLTYRVVSTATGDGSGTEIEAYVASVYGDYSGITNQVITSLGEINYYGQVTIDPPEGEENGPEDYYDPSLWPTAGKLAQFYLEGVEYEEYYSDTIELDGANLMKGPLYRDGELDIKNSSNTAATLTLTGTFYITDDTDIGISGSGQNTLTLDLHGHTIFVESSSTGSGKEALQIGGKCTIKGPGAIIAVGDIYFAPKGDVGCIGGPVFILSVEGSTYLQPSGDFYGAVAGNVTVDVKSGSGQSINYPEGGFGDLNFPGCTGTQLIYSIASWDISQQ